MGKRWVGTRELAEAANVTRKTIADWAKSGMLPPPLPGFRHLRWRWEDLKHLFGCDSVETDDIATKAE